MKNKIGYFGLKSKLIQFLKKSAIIQKYFSNH